MLIKKQDLSVAGAEGGAASSAGRKLWEPDFGGLMPGLPAFIFGWD